MISLCYGAFAEERQRWEVSGQLNFSAESESAVATGEAKPIPPGHKAIVAHVPGNVWKVTVTPGQSIARDQPRVILESMKMEVSVVAQEPGTATEIFCAEGRPVQASTAAWAKVEEAQARAVDFLREIQLIHSPRCSRGQPDQRPPQSQEFGFKMLLQQRLAWRS